MKPLNLSISLSLSHVAVGGVSVFAVVSCDYLVSGQTCSKRIIKTGGRKGDTNVAKNVQLCESLFTEVMCTRWISFASFSM